MVLEKYVVLVGGAADATENVTLHEFINIRAKAVNNL